MSDIKFEHALEKLEEIVALLESGDIPLEKSLAKYEEGLKLANICQKKLEVAKKKVEILTRTKDGKIKLEPFDSDEPENKNIKKKQKEEEIDDLFQ